MSEKSEAARDGATLQKNSGRGSIRKGDAVIEPFLIDYKEYPKGFSVNKTNWAKVCTDAFSNGRRHPAIKIVLGESNSKTRLWVIDDGMFKEMLTAWREKYE